MTRLDRLRDLARGRPVLAVFCLLASLPVALAVLSFRPFVGVPPAVLTVLEDLFRLVVYMPVAAIRTVLFDPLGLGYVFSTAVVGHLLVFASLLAFYYGVSLLLVRGATVVRELLDGR